MNKNVLFTTITLGIALASAVAFGAGPISTPVPATTSHTTSGSCEVEAKKADEFYQKIDSACDSGTTDLSSFAAEGKTIIDACRAACASDAEELQECGVAEELKCEAQGGEDGDDGGDDADKNDDKDGDDKDDNGGDDRDN